MKRLSGKRAFITGVAIATELAEKGADIAFSFVRSGDAAKELARETEGLGVNAFPEGSLSIRTLRYRGQKQVGVDKFFSI